jgi:Holliday junction resolvase RusA-like endonuclease
MGYRVLGTREDKWQPRKGLEGPFFYANGKVLYYDPKAGEYWDPTTDFYMSREDMDNLHQMTIDILAKERIVRV